MGFFSQLFSRPDPEQPWSWPTDVTPSGPTKLSVDDLRASAVTPPNPVQGWYGGDKYPGGFGPTQIFDVDYWTLRERSAQLFTENLYARGLIRRIITNEINTGLTLEAKPDESILGVASDSLSDWSEDTENRFELWAKNPELCDYKGRQTFGEIQRVALTEALIAGDVLFVLHVSPVTGLPLVQLISGDCVRTPLIAPEIAEGHSIYEGVELDDKGRHVAYWVEQETSEVVTAPSIRIPVQGEQSGRRVAWMVYGTDRRMGDVRGQPLLSLVMQAIKEIDRYRDAALRKATLNAIIAFFIKKTENKPGSLPISGGAVRRSTSSVDDVDSTVREFGISQHIPGMIIEELQQGEEPVPHSTAGTDVNFGPFEKAILDAIAWANGIPPEIYKLAFTDNYSASQAAINEYKMTLNMRRTKTGEESLQPIYVEWLVSSVIDKRIRAPGFLDAWRDPKQYDIFAAWVASDWSGAIKPSTDVLKQAKGYKLLNNEGWITNDRATRELTGTKFSKNIKRLRIENEMKAAAARPLLELEQEFGKSETERALTKLEAVS